MERELDRRRALVAGSGARCKFRADSITLNDRETATLTDTIEIAVEAGRER